MNLRWASVRRFWGARRAVVIAGAILLVSGSAVAIYVVSQGFDRHPNGTSSGLVSRTSPVATASTSPGSTATVTPIASPSARPSQPSPVPSRASGGHTPGPRAPSPSPTPPRPTPSPVPSPAASPTPSPPPSPTPTPTPSPTPGPAVTCVHGSIAGATAVTASDFTFSPSVVTVALGGSVTWTETGGAHTTTSNNSLWNYAFTATGDSYSCTFHTAGSYSYHCTPHQSLGMVGTITVAAQSAANGASSAELARSADSTRFHLMTANLPETNDNRSCECCCCCGNRVARTTAS